VGHHSMFPKVDSMFPTVYSTSARWTTVPRGCASVP
jgi:hypothetical protein